MKGSNGFTCIRAFHQASVKALVGSGLLNSHSTSHTPVEFCNSSMSPSLAIQRCEARDISFAILSWYLHTTCTRLGRYR
jgi:hypothetical protein